MKTIIIDNEETKCKTLSNLLHRFCPSVILKGIAGKVDEGYELIRSVKPDLVFLDVCLQAESGFDLLKLFTVIDFQVIFVTKTREFAINAFEFGAVDYILKPVDHQKLILSVDKAYRNMTLATGRNIVSFINSAAHKSSLPGRLSLHRNGKVIFVDVNDISYICAVGNYCEIITVDSQHFLCTRTLLSYERLLSVNGNFIRANKKLLVNILHITGYTKGSSCFISLKNNDEFEISRRKKGELLQKLKDLSAETLNKSA